MFAYVCYPNSATNTSARVHIERGYAIRLAEIFTRSWPFGLAPTLLCRRNTTPVMMLQWLRRHLKTEKKTLI